MWGLFHPFLLGIALLKWLTNRGYSVTVDDRLTHTPHLSEVKKNFSNKFLSKSALEQISFSVILPWLLNQLETKKATGLDRIPCKLLKISTSIVGPSLAYIFKSCINAEIFPNEWKIAKVTLHRCLRKDPSVN